MQGTFVIQQHRTSESICHFDLMLDQGQSLLTFQLPAPPHHLTPGQSLPAARLPDHRRIYLTYEGPVSGNRGTVRIALKGNFDLNIDQSETWLLTLHTADADLRYRIDQPSALQPRLTRLPD